MNEEYINSVNLNSETDFPYLVLDVVNDESYPRNPGFQVMHWHEDLQFIYVISGEIEVATLAEQIRLTRGEGIFINRNVVHLVRKIGACHYNSFIFPERMLKFYTGSPAEKIVDKIVGRGEFPISRISDTVGHTVVLQVLRRLSALENEKTPLYQYEVLTLLCTLWLEFSRVTELPERRRRSISEERCETFLRYITVHFSEEISLKTLAASANVSVSECLRCFRSVMNTTPYSYITEFRLSKAAELLRTTDEPVSSVAEMVGFCHLSHFGKCFREKTGMSPSEYRKFVRPDIFLI